MKAMIFAAGLGTRLQPLTHTIPKALVKLNNKPLLQHLIEKMIRHGITEIILNTHHFSKEVIHFLKANNNFGIDISISEESDELLDTGGGLKKASWFFNDGKPFLVHNVDVISDIDFVSLHKIHTSNKAIATLAVRNRATSRYLHFNQENLLCGWENAKTGETKGIVRKGQTTNLAFSGVHIIDPKLFELLNEDGCFSIIDVYLDLAKNQRIMAYNHTDDLWIDVGNIENLKKAEAVFP
jgi:NDP-sugar pyrophosphorylase family protein